MILNLKDYMEFIKSRGLNNKGSIISQILKNERLKHNLTLEELSKGICSVSYLCKLENYCIQSKRSYIKELFEKMNLDYDEICKNNFDGLVEETLKNYFFERYDEIINTYNRINNDVTNYPCLLVKCFNFLVTKQFDLFEEEVKSLDAVKYTLSGLDSVVFVYLVIQYLNMRCDYKTALDYLRGLEILNISHKYLEFLLLEANMIVSFNLNIGSRLLNSYSEYQTKTFVGYPVGRKCMMRMIYNAYIVKEYPDKVFDDINTIDYEQIPCDYRFDILYYQYLINFDYSDEVNMFNDIVDKGYYIDVRFVGLLACLAYKINQKSNYDTLLNIMEGTRFESIDIIHKKFVCFILLYASSMKNDELANYMRTDIIPNLSKEINPMYNEIYKEVFINLLVSTSKYKEVFYLLNNVDKKILNSKLKNFRN